MVFRDAWIVSSSKYNSSNSLLYYSSKQHSNASWWSFDLEFSECFCNNKFGISITALNKIPFNGESWIQSFNSLVVSSIYLFPHEPQGKRKRFLCQKTILSHIMSMVFDEMVLSTYHQGYSIVREAFVSLSLLVDGILCLLLSDGLSLSLHLAWCWFSPVSVLYVLLQCWLVKRSFNRKFWLTLLTGYDGEVSVGRVFFDLSYSLGPLSSSNRKKDAELELVFTGLFWSILLDLSFDFNILWFITCIINFEKANTYHIAVHMFRSDEWIDMCVIWFLQETKLKKYLQGLIFPTSQATFPVVSHVFTNAWW